MKWLLAFICLPCLSFGQIDFSKVTEAKIYVYNINDKKGRPDFLIYADGSYAPTTRPVAKPVSNEDLDKLKKLLSKNTDGLQAGLSACFIPRHGVVFHDAKGDVIGSLSICFQCEAIRIWPNKQAPRPKKVNEKKALKQLGIIRDVVENSGWKVFKKPEDYLKNL